jgi:hypothetical protein
MLLRRSKNAAADLMAVNFSGITCQGLQRHPFPGKDKEESLAGGTARLFEVKLNLLSKERCNGLHRQKHLAGIQFNKIIFRVKCFGIFIQGIDDQGH